METFILSAFGILFFAGTFGVMVFGPTIRERQFKQAVAAVNSMTPEQIQARVQRVQAEVKEQEG